VSVSLSVCIMQQCSHSIFIYFSGLDCDSELLKSHMKLEMSILGKIMKSYVVLMLYNPPVHHCKMFTMLDCSPSDRTLFES
jgi:hypothetical protein